MPGKITMAKAAKKAPAKGKLAKGGLKIGKHKAARTPAGSAVFLAKALATDERARRDVRDAVASARKAYKRSSDRRGRPSIGAFVGDSKARREAQKAVASLREALQIADTKRKKPKSAKGPAIVVLAVAGAGTALAVNEDLRAKALGLFGAGEASGGSPTA